MDGSPAIRASLERMEPVSDKAWQQLSAFAACLQHWQQRMNLVAPATIAHLWDRHIADSWQLVPVLKRCDQGTLLDLGSGGGLPGIVLRIGGLEPVHLVEANQRKAAFLRQAAFETGANVTVHARRIESLPAAGIGRPAAIVARALAPLKQLLSLAFPLVSPETTLVLPKGRRWQEELAEALVAYSFVWRHTPSVTESDSVILELRNVSKREGVGA